MSHRKKSSRSPATMTDVRTWLAGQDTDTLVDLILAQADEDDRLRRRLLRTVARARATGLDLDAYRQTLDAAMDTDGFVDYYHAGEYAAGIEEAIDEIEELLGAGHAAEVVELSEYALEAVEAALGHADDSDGNLGMILERLQDLHLAACRKARPDAEELAKRLFLWELQTEWDTFCGAAETYRSVLGKKGLAAYKKCAEEQWADVRPLGPGDDDRVRYGGRFRITRIMETLARLSGDVEALVEVKKRSLSTAYDFYRIAETYQKAGMHEQALEWAEKGIAAFPERTDSRLRELLADEYHRRKRHTEAMEVVWQDFVDRPGLERYRGLKRHADKAGCWDEWRTRALDLLRPSPVGTVRGSPGRERTESRRRDGSRLVEVLLWDGDVEAAWQAAREWGCFDGLWMELADRRAREHPDEAVPIYQRHIPQILNQKNNAAYREAVAILKKIQESMTRLDQQAEFERYLESVRAEHRRKRNFMKMLDREDWPNVVPPA
jgi:tetratricopeptide (TPR) repeat protein